ncbi:MULTISPECIES: peptidase inhibitor family I36 protein [Kitasatospora]|uniref:Peptidase inhibitor family I36 n=1 Tax=Kitasatospora setae (strain ATCC 33774 / DSM 43861 / JCM 3304 / KCC A-0304 / NBRC 14216 / KM-6054) TaxID=452652 RepID=E4NJV4_KITSK|nr:MULTISPECIES: peptidase inhibitor family I36 protein [Kitasatospora]BAJ33252.1 hypothetical protein KSE_74980 [Kitasatospora setae KM-6054]
MRLRVKTAMAAAIAMAATLLPAGSAQAAHGRTGTAACPSGYLCVWDQPDFRGRMYRFLGDNASWGDWAIDNNDRSWFNNGTSGTYACVWQYVNLVGHAKALAPGEASPDDPGHAGRGSSNDWRRGGCE